MALTWTPEMDAQLAVLHSDKIPFSQMPDAIEGTTRNACIGRAHRLGLKRGPSYSERTSRATGKPKKRKVPKREQFMFWSRPHVKAPVFAAAPILQPDRGPLVPNVVVISFGDLEKTNCHYPLDGDKSAPTVFCGDTAIDGKPYCKAHMALCYVKPRIRPNSNQQSYLIHRFTAGDHTGTFDALAQVEVSNG